MEHADLVRAARWGPRLCVISPLIAASALAIGLLAPRGGESPLPATALAVAFLGAGAGLAGLFTTLLAGERASEFVRPRWALPCAIGGIAANFSAGLVGLLR